MENPNNIKRSRFHLLQPNYKNLNYNLSTDLKKRILDKLIFLYGVKQAQTCFTELERLMKVYYSHKSQAMIDWENNFNPRDRFTQKDVFLITYGDLIREKDQPPLKTLAEVSKRYFKGVFNTLHILPFFPYSSDRGFSIMDFEEVDPQLGTWEDIAVIKDDFRLMFDGVFNHVSSQSRMFREFLNQNPNYKDFFTVFSTRKKISKDHLQLIVRPRTSDLLTTFDTLNGPMLVWTTFSPDQIDLNFKNPKVLAKMVEIMLLYVCKGADFIRLDAVTYLWDELGTTGAHLIQTHTIIKLFRDILDAVAPHVSLITETNVPQVENMEYFGNGYDEAQMVYNFALPPLVLHSFQTGNASALSQWAAGINKISDTATYFNFLDSHDGVGLMAVKDILSLKEIEMMALKVVEHGGFISYKTESDGSVSPYELNVTWYSAVNREGANESDELQVRRYIASRAIALVMMGVPGVYLHGLLGSKNDAEAVIEEEQTRSINRKCLKKRDLIRALLNPETTTYKVTHQLAELIFKRSQEYAFHPNASQRIFNVCEGLFTVLRISPDEKEYILAVTNVTPLVQEFQLDLKKHKLASNDWQDIISGKLFPDQQNELKFKIEAYGIYWLKTSVEE